jgi:hypothetical protein
MYLDTFCGMWYATILARRLRDKHCGCCLSDGFLCHHIGRAIGEQCSTKITTSGRAFLGQGAMAGPALMGGNGATALGPPKAGAPTQVVIH